MGEALDLSFKAIYEHMIQEIGDIMERLRRVRAIEHLIGEAERLFRNGMYREAVHKLDEALDRISSV